MMIFVLHLTLTWIAGTKKKESFSFGRVRTINILEWKCKHQNVQVHILQSNAFFG